MILDLDVGNTRIKWRLLAADGGMLQRGAVATAAQAVNACFSALMDQVGKLDAGEPCRVRVSSVRDSGFNSALTAFLESNWGVSPEYAKVTRSCGGVTNAYDDYSRMGVDRWLAMIAAFQRTQGGCAIMDLGSAITFDIINGAGEHQGGYIVPGLQLMLDSLKGKSAALDVNPDGELNPVPGKNTQTAIGGGLLTMVVGFASRCHQEAEKEYGDVAWFLTGGDAVTVGQQLPWKHDMIPDLVLEGLALALP